MYPNDPYSNQNKSKLASRDNTPTFSRNSRISGYPQRLNETGGAYGNNMSNNLGISGRKITISHLRDNTPTFSRHSRISEYSSLNQRLNETTGGYGNNMSSNLGISGNKITIPSSNMYSSILTSGNNLGNNTGMPKINFFNKRGTSSNNRRTNIETSAYSNIPTSGNNTINNARKPNFSFAHNATTSASNTRYTATSVSNTRHNTETSELPSLTKMSKKRDISLTPSAQIKQETKTNNFLKKRKKNLKKNKDLLIQNFFPDTNKNQIQNNMPLQGQIPDGGPLTYFTEEQVGRDGNCGFTTLGANRGQVADVLLQLVGQVQNRNFLRPEIHEALIGGELDNLRGQLLITELNNIQNNLNQLVDNIQHTFLDTQALTVANTPQWLENNGQTQLANQLRQTSLALDNAQQALENFYTNSNTVHQYIELLRDENRRLWLGYRSALLYARHQNMTLYIWRRRSVGSQELELIHHHAPNNPSNSQVIHMLHTEGFTHFNLLVEQTQASQVLDQSSVMNKSKQLVQNLSLQKSLEAEQQISTIKLLPGTSNQYNFRVNKYKKLTQPASKPAQELVNRLEKIVACLSEKVDISKHTSFLLGLNRATMNALEDKDDDNRIKHIKELGRDAKNNLPFFEPSIRDKANKKYQEECLIQWYIVLNKILNIAEAALRGYAGLSEKQIQEILLKAFQVFGNKPIRCNKGSLADCLLAYSYLLNKLPSDNTVKPNQNIITNQEFDEDVNEAINEVSKKNRVIDMEKAEDKELFNMTVRLLKNLSMTGEVLKLVDEIKPDIDEKARSEKADNYFWMLAMYILENWLDPKDPKAQSTAMEQLRTQERNRKAQLDRFKMRK